VVDDEEEHFQAIMAAHHVNNKLNSINTTLPSTMSSSSNARHISKPSEDGSEGEKGGIMVPLAVEAEYAEQTISQ